MQLGELARAAARLDAAADRENVTVTATPLTDFVVGSSLRRGLWLMLGAVVFVLLIRCVNLANLQTSRASSRQRELLIRSTIGASRGRITRQLLTESAVLAGVGGLLGIVIAVVGVGAGAPRDGIRSTDCAADRVKEAPPRSRQELRIGIIGRP